MGFLLYYGWVWSKWLFWEALPLKCLFTKWLQCELSRHGVATFQEGDVTRPPWFFRRPSQVSLISFLIFSFPQLLVIILPLFSFEKNSLPPFFARKKNLRPPFFLPSKFLPSFYASAFSHKFSPPKFPCKRVFERLPPSICMQRHSPSPRSRAKYI